jgi:hypothetical protein
MIYPELAVLIMERDYPGNGKCEAADQVFHDLNWMGKLKPYQLNDQKTYMLAGHTSMCVGDYIVFEDGTIYLCAAVGWREVTGDDLNQKPRQYWTEKLAKCGLKVQYRFHRIDRADGQPKQNETYKIYDTESRELAYTAYSLRDFAIFAACRLYEAFTRGTIKEGDYLDGR